MNFIGYGVVRALFSSSLLFYCIYYMEKHPTHVIWAQSKTSNTLCITWGSKWKKLWQTIYKSNYKQNYSKLLQWKMCILCKYTLKFTICTRSMELFKLYSKEKSIFWLIKLLFIKVRCLISVDLSLEVKLEGLRYFWKRKNVFDLPSYYSNLRKRYTLRLLSKNLFSLAETLYTENLSNITSSWNFTCHW